MVGRGRAGRERVGQEGKVGREWDRKGREGESGIGREGRERVG